MNYGINCLELEAATPMSAAPIFAIVCCIVGGLAGAASGFRHSFLLGVGGAAIGFVLGILSFLALVIPYVWCLVQLERRHRLWVLWGNLALPMQASALFLAALLAWFVVGLLA